jgi:hypothetical protein
MTVIMTLIRVDALYGDPTCGGGDERVLVPGLHQEPIRPVQWVLLILVV